MLVVVETSMILSDEASQFGCALEYKVPDTNIRRGDGTLFEEGNGYGGISRNRPLIGRELSGQDTKEGALPRPVRSEKTDFFPFMNSEGNALEKIFIPHAERKVFNGYKVH
jgi:hypothetical protein